MEIKVVDAGEGFHGTSVIKGAWQDAKQGREDFFRERKVSAAVCGEIVLIVFGTGGYTHKSALGRALHKCGLEEPSGQGGGVFWFTNEGNPGIGGKSESLRASVPEAAIPYALEYLRQKTAQYESEN